MNNARNEVTIDLAGEKIILRPTFENIAAMESNLGGISYLGWKFSRGAKLDSNGNPVMDYGQAAKNLPSMSEIAQIIYYNQAATKADDPTLKKYSLEEVFNLVVRTGQAKVVAPITMFITKLLAGDKLNPVDDITDEEKKSI